MITAMTRFTRPLALLTGAALLSVAAFSLTPGITAQTGPADDYAAGFEHWQAGRYDQALPIFIKLIDTPGGAPHLESIALLTGEWFPSVQVAADGRNPRLSPDGRFVSFETGPAVDPVTRVVRAQAGGAPVAEFRGSGAVVSPAGTHIAYIRPVDNEAWKTAQTNTLAAAWATALEGQLVIRDLQSGAERVANTGSLLKSAPQWAADGTQLLFVGSEEADLARSDIYRTRATGAPERLTAAAGNKALVAASSAAIVYTTSTQPTFRRPPAPGTPPAGGGRGGGRGGQGAAAPVSTVVNLATGATHDITGSGLTMSADGSTLAWITRDGATYALHTSPTLTHTPTTVRTGTLRLDAPALSPDGSAVAYQLMEFTDWEIYLSRGTTHTRVTRDIQHDLLPRFLTNDTLLGMMGEARHRRSQVYDLNTGARRRLLHNNTIRTVVPEYSWQASMDGRIILTVADYDGDTITPERSLHVSDITKTVSAADLRARLTQQLAHETELRTRTTRMFEPIASTVRQVLSAASVERVYAHARNLYDFDSKHVTQPGNAKAIEYLTNAYRSFGYEPQQQWFDQPNAFGGRTANVLATLRGTVDPHLIYVVSSHFDSVAIGPGADDDTSGTTALLEAARLLAKTPMPATIVFASFTGEEAGLLGSRQFVRQAAADKWQISGALNNDMIGWAGEGPQLNNTIRYSNPGIRDLQHAAAFLFTDLVLFDTKYYRGTDAAAFYEGWGDIVGGIGSYPILANPNYHQPTDYLDTINQHQVTETAKVTAATLMYLASSPARLKNVRTSAAGNATTVTWDAAPESNIREYIVAYGPADDPMRTRVTVRTPTASLPALPAGTHVAVKAINARGLEGWDWARAIVQ
jgi:hypothetical protein